MAADSGPKSLYDLVYHHNGFLVNPLLWTSRHLDLVGCRFEDAITSLPCREPVQDDQKTEETHLKPQPHAEVLALKPHPVDKLRALFSILVGREHEFARYRRGYTFYFQGRPVHRPEYLVFHRHEQPPDRIYNNSPPVIGYVYYTNISGARGRRFEACPGPGGIDNQIGINIRNIKISQTKPKEWTEDPYFLCHLLALAQFQGRKSQLPEPKSYISRLLITNVFYQEYILFCEAEISTELLGALKNPKTAKNAIPWPTVHRKKIPYQPYATFPDRLTAELVGPSRYERSPVENDRKRLHDGENAESNNKKRTIPYSIRNHERGHEP